MEHLINQAFTPVENLAPRVRAGEYDLLGPDAEIILPSVWETTVKPDWIVTMTMWRLPEKPAPPKQTQLPPLQPMPMPAMPSFDDAREHRHRSKSRHTRERELQMPRRVSPPEVQMPRRVSPPQMQQAPQRRSSPVAGMMLPPPPPFDFRDDMFVPFEARERERKKKEKAPALVAVVNGRRGWVRQRGGT